MGGDAVTETIGLPAYQQVADDLRAMISRGDLNVGDAIPSTAQLCARYKVSATVVRAAVSQLRTDGIVRGQPGKAVYVVATPQAIKDKGVRLENVAAGVEDLRDGLQDVTNRLDRAADATVVEKLRTDLEDLRRQVAEVQTALIDLYGRTGQEYPRGRSDRRSEPGRRKGVG